MSEQFVDAVEQRPVRFCGVFRSDQHGVVGAREAALLGAIVRNAWRNNFDGRGVPEGTLAHLVAKNLNDKAWKLSIQRLIDWQFVQLEAGYKGGWPRVVLTPAGRAAAIQLCGDRQREGKPVDSGA